MSRILIAVIALSVLGFLAYRTLYGRSAVSSSSEPEAPTQQLENVRAKAKEIEANDQQHVDDIEKRMQE